MPDVNKKLSDGYEEAEASRGKEIEDKRIESENKTLKVFFHLAKKGQLGGRFVDIPSPDGKVLKRENPVRFEENIWISRDKAEIEFIRGHDSFGVHCFECKDMADAEGRRAIQIAAKQNRKITVDLDIQADGVDIGKGLTAE